MADRATAQRHLGDVLAHPQQKTDPADRVAGAIAKLHYPKSPGSRRGLSTPQILTYSALTLSAVAAGGIAGFLYENHLGPFSQSPGEGEQQIPNNELHFQGGYITILHNQQVDVTVPAPTAENPYNYDSVVGPHDIAIYTHQTDAGNVNMTVIEAPTSYSFAKANIDGNDTLVVKDASGQQVAVFNTQTGEIEISSTSDAAVNFARELQYSDGIIHHGATVPDTNPGPGRDPSLVNGRDFDFIGSPTQPGGHLEDPGVFRITGPIEMGYGADSFKTTSGEIMITPVGVAISPELARVLGIIDSQTTQPIPPSMR